LLIGFIGENGDGMNDQKISHARKIDKRQITAMATFAMTNIPNTDEFTLKKFLELMNTTGTYGMITCKQFKRTVELMKKYIPNTCDYSLNVLIDLLRTYFLLEGEMDDDGGDARPNQVNPSGSNNGSQGMAAFQNGRHSKNERHRVLPSNGH
jgi:hypothetical protein